ncbi:hypothetical protein KC19_VG110000 [Ceratodon purpureus]|uniref:Uncharacterized protein n=1 Tax=Ceratodon purpureus TaxID=3225 RepID=A0A8T0HP95_CERPU|nr:hypothetical protein KC19_VG110000 [Ceratodon purpureus]
MHSLQCLIIFNATNPSICTTRNGTTSASTCAACAKELSGAAIKQTNPVNHQPFNQSIPLLTNANKLLRKNR